MISSFWSIEDTVEVNTGKDNYEKAKIMVANIDRSKFTVRLLDLSFSNEFQVNCNLLRLSMPNKSNWNINDLCEFKNPKDNKWHLANITNIDLNTQTFIVTILFTKKEWKVTIASQNLYIRLPYDTKIHWMNYKTINPITGTSWYFISDLTHVFKKLRNNLSKSYIGEGKGKRHICLTSWSKMRVDLAEQTLSANIS